MRPAAAPLRSAHPVVRAGAAVGAVGAACVAYGVVVERRWYRLRRVTLPGALQPGAGDPLRILHVSDVHLTPPQPRKVAFLADVARESYDLVVLTGDLLGDIGSEDAAVAALAPLTRMTPGLFVLGSNDLFGPTPKSPSRYFLDPDARMYGPRLDTERLVAGLAGIGVTTLRNETTTVRTPAGAVAVAGVDDPHLHEAVLPDVEDLHPPEVTDAVLRLGLVHAPYTAALDRLLAAGLDVLLAGHTHGGQVRFPPIGAVVANCDLPLDQIRGVSRYRDHWLHVSPGLGTSKFAPFRFACRPEVTLLTLLP